MTTRLRDKLCWGTHKTCHCRSLRQFGRKERVSRWHFRKLGQRHTEPLRIFFFGVILRRLKLNCDEGVLQPQGVPAKVVSQVPSLWQIRIGEPAYPEIHSPMPVRFDKVSGQEALATVSFAQTLRVQGTPDTTVSHVPLASQ